MEINGSSEKRKSQESDFFTFYTFMSDDILIFFTYITEDKNTEYIEIGKDLEKNK